MCGTGHILKSRMGESLPCQESATGELGLATVLAYADTEVTAHSGLIRPELLCPHFPQMHHSEWISSPSFSTPVGGVQQQPTCDAGFEAKTGKEPL